MDRKPAGGRGAGQGGVVGAAAVVGGQPGWQALGVQQARLPRGRTAPAPILSGAPPQLTGGGAGAISLLNEEGAHV